jgi:hypothetical protein
MALPKSIRHFNRAPRPAALVRVGPNSANLIFLNPEDQKDFPLN